MGCHLGRACIAQAVHAEKTHMLFIFKLSLISYTECQGSTWFPCPEVTQHNMWHPEVAQHNMWHPNCSDGLAQLQRMGSQGMQAVCMPLSPCMDFTLIPLCLSHLLGINFFPAKLHCGQQLRVKGEDSHNRLGPFWADTTPYFTSSWKATAI